MKKVILLVMVLTTEITAFGQTGNEPIVLTTETGEIKGTLLVPQSVVKPKIVLIVAGSGPTDRNGNFPSASNNSLKMLAEGLYENGMASIRYDKRGIGESRAAGFAEVDLRFEHYVEDVKAWVEFIKADSRFGDLIIVGHSEGSLIGMISSQTRQVAKFISLAGVGSSAAELIQEQLKEQPSSVLEQALPILERLEKGEFVKEVPQTLFPLFRPSVQPYLISWFKYNPQEEISKLSCPILIVQGTTDIQVGLENADKLSASNSRAQKITIEGMNHILKTANLNRRDNLATYTNPDLPLADELIQKLVNFINEN